MNPCQVSQFFCAKAYERNSHFSRVHVRGKGTRADTDRQSDRSNDTRRAARLLRTVFHGTGCLSLASRNTTFAAQNTVSNDRRRTACVSRDINQATGRRTTRSLIMNGARRRLTTTFDDCIAAFFFFALFSLPLFLVFVRGNVYRGGTSFAVSRRDRCNRVRRAKTALPFPPAGSAVYSLSRQKATRLRAARNDFRLAGRSATAARPFTVRRLRK